MIVIQKYGGSSVATIEKIKSIAQYLVKRQVEGYKQVIVVSAMGKTTDKLISLANEITYTPNLREMDRLLSIGEQQTIALLSIMINSIGGRAISMTGEQAGIKTYGTHTKNKIESIDNANILKEIEKGNIVVVAGFQGINNRNDITTLGRGGSDTTAVALAISLDAKCEIYTDVEGIYTIDPRIYPDSKKIDKISYEEMLELAFTGAGVMETRSIELGYKYKKDIYVAKTLSPNKGTLITNKENILESKLITGIAINKNILHITVDNIPTYAKNIFPIFNKAEELSIPIEMISQNDVISEHGSFAFTTKKTEKYVCNELVEYIKKSYPDVKILLNDKMAKLTIVGIGLMTQSTIITKIFKILSENNISFHQIATSEISISLIIDENIIDNVAKLISRELNL